MKEGDWLNSKNPGDMLFWLLSNWGTRPKYDRKMVLWAANCDVLMNSDEVGCLDDSVIDRTRFPDLNVHAIEAYGGITVSKEILAQRADMMRDIFGNPFQALVREHPYAVYQSTKDCNVTVLLDSYLTDPVLSIAQECYNSRDFSSMPVLGDAFEDAGCSDSIILDHCRMKDHVIATEVITGINCPWCGKRGAWRHGVNFEHEMICLRTSDCHSWEPGETISVRRKVKGQHYKGCHVVDLIIGKEKFG